MEYRVEELAAQAGVKVDTLRFYQGRGLLPPPRREGRIAIYGASHRERLLRIRSLLADGFTLAQIRRLFDAESTEEKGARPTLTAPTTAASDRGEALLTALVEESLGDRTLSRAELASESGVPEALLTAAQAAGLVEPIVVEGRDRFSSADLEMARAGLAILGVGFPLQELLALSVRHASGVRESAEAAIDLFDDNVIARAGSESEAADAIADAFRTLLPQVTRLVALHFQRTLVNRALERLRAKGDSEALERALAVTESARLEVSWHR